MQALNKPSRNQVDLMGLSCIFRVTGLTVTFNPVVKARHNHRPRATALDWSNDLSKTYRLLDWLNLNQLERDVVFSVPKKGRQPDAFKSRKDCFIEAAHYIFTVEDDPLVNREISKDPTRVATAIGNRLER
jgi:hypothetical protein